MHARALLLAALCAPLVSAPVALRAQGAQAAPARAYTEGSVWDITMIRATAGMEDDYLKSLGTTWKPILEEAKKQGLVLSYKVLSANAATADDWDILLMVEYKNWAVFDGISDKFNAIERKIVGTEDQSRQLMTQRLNVRRIIGSKTGQELILK